MNKNDVKSGKTVRNRGGFAELLLIAYRNIYRNKRRSAFCILAIAVTVFFIILMAAVMEGFTDSFRRQVLTYETGHVLLTSAEYEKKSLFQPLQYPLELPGKDLPALIRELEQQPDVVKAFPRIRTRVNLLNSVVKNALLWGMDMEKELPYNIFNYKTKNANQCLVAGRYPSEEANECVIGYRLAEKMGLGIGDKVQMRLVSSEFSNKYYFPEVVGITDFNVGEYDKSVIIIPFSKAQKLSTLQGKTQTLYVYTRNEKAAGSVAAALSEQYQAYPELSVKPFTRHPFLVMLQVSDIMMAVVYIIFMVVASFLIINTVIMVIHERIKEIGMMGSLGMTRGEIVGVFFLESLVLSGLGSLLGSVVAGLTTFALSLFPFDIGSLMEDMITINSTLFVKFSPFIIGQGLLYGLGISALCTIFPSLKSAFIKPVEALRR